LEQTPLAKENIKTAGTTPSLVQEGSKAMTLSDSHQFAIDEEFLAQSGFGSSGSKNGKSKTRRRKGLSLSEYLERKANGSL